MTERQPIGKCRTENEVLVVTLRGSLDVSLQRVLRDRLQVLTSKQGDAVLDFTEVPFIDSACLGVLVSLARELRGRGGDFRIVGLTDETRAIFQITRIERVFRIFDSVGEAVASYFR